MRYKTKYFSPIGELTLASDGENLTGLWINRQKYHGELKYDMEIIDDLEVFRKAKDYLDRYFSLQKLKRDEVSMLFKGTDFQKQVWKILTEIPYGEVVTYKDISDIYAKNNNIKSMSPQAIGGAVGKNPISIIVPCHRVVGLNKSLTGFAGGIDIKVKLLEIEEVDVSLYIT